MVFVYAIMVHGKREESCDAYNQLFDKNSSSQHPEKKSKLTENSFHLLKFDFVF